MADESIRDRIAALLSGSWMAKVEPDPELVRQGGYFNYGPMARGFENMRQPDIARQAEQIPPLEQVPLPLVDPRRRR